jgi:hypothetical protein
MTRNISVMGIYPDQTTVSDTVEALHRAGYRKTDIALLSSDNRGSRDFAHEKHTRASQGAAWGAAAGAVTGAALAWIASTQSVAIAGLGPLVTAGPLLAALAGAGAGGALGWLAGMLAGLRLTDYVAKRFAGRIRRGRILLSVHCDSPEWCNRAKKILRNTGALDISSATETAGDYTAGDKPADMAPAPRTEFSPQETTQSVTHETTK